MYVVVLALAALIADMSDKMFIHGRGEGLPGEIRILGQGSFSERSPQKMV